MINTRYNVTVETIAYRFSSFFYLFIILFFILGKKNKKTPFSLRSQITADFSRLSNAYKENGAWKIS